MDNSSSSLSVSSMWDLANYSLLVAVVRSHLGQKYQRICGCDGTCVARVSMYIFRFAVARVWHGEVSPRPSVVVPERY